VTVEGGLEVEKTMRRKKSRNKWKSLVVLVHLFNVEVLENGPEEKKEEHWKDGVKRKRGGKREGHTHIHTHGGKAPRDIAMMYTLKNVSMMTASLMVVGERFDRLEMLAYSQNKPRKLCNDVDAMG
jgi:hypothetical protein